MTEAKIIDCIRKNTSCSYVAVGEDNKPIESTRCYQFGEVGLAKIVNELLALVEQEKRETLKKYAKKLQKAFTGKPQFLAWRCQQIVEYRLRDEYGVEL